MAQASTIAVILFTMHLLLSTDRCSVTGENRLVTDRSSGTLTSEHTSHHLSGKAVQDTDSGLKREISGNKRGKAGKRGAESECKKAPGEGLWGERKVNEATRSFSRRRDGRA
ncbi:hypothetical protein GMST_12300 [Geomonas silvestris]|uniref:Uncharacterized protein n=1 Tax=Geomonas silvestris TaxID=2740184 RepID=A0A6V8MG00_9BACT|nr:hypothetical protein GMST_12300 [Geomonas silvestris]